MYRDSNVFALGCWNVSNSMVRLYLQIDLFGMSIFHGFMSDTLN
jgi:hypothetical protein